MAVINVYGETGKSPQNVCLKKATSKQKELIAKIDKESYAEDKDLVETIHSAVVDINNDNKLDIAYSDRGRAGSCGTEWSILQNMGNGKYNVISVTDCLSDCLVFLPETTNGYRVIKSGKTKYIYDNNKRSYVEK